ncbi:unnamed protein product [Cunninghamella echinulata]
MAKTPRFSHNKQIMDLKLTILSGQSKFISFMEPDTNDNYKLYKEMISSQPPSASVASIINWEQAIYTTVTYCKDKNNQLDPPGLSSLNQRCTLA